VPARDSIRQHMPAYVSIRQHTSAYVSTHQLESVPARDPKLVPAAQQLHALDRLRKQLPSHSSCCCCSSSSSSCRVAGRVGRVGEQEGVEARQKPRSRHRLNSLRHLRLVQPTYVSLRPHTSAYVSLRQRSLRHLRLVQPTYVNIRQHTSAYVSLRQPTSAYVSAL